MRKALAILAVVGLVAGGAVAAPVVNSRAVQQYDFDGATPGGSVANLGTAGSAYDGTLATATDAGAGSVAVVAEADLAGTGAQAGRVWEAGDVLQVKVDNTIGSWYTGGGSSDTGVAAFTTPDNNAIDGDALETNPAGGITMSFWLKPVYDGNDAVNQANQHYFLGDDALRIGTGANSQWSSTSGGFQRATINETDGVGASNGAAGIYVPNEWHFYTVTCSPIGNPDSLFNDQDDPKVALSVYRDGNLVWSDGSGWYVPSFWYQGALDGTHGLTIGNVRYMMMSTTDTAQTFEFFIDGVQAEVGTLGLSNDPNDTDDQKWWTTSGQTNLESQAAALYDSQFVPEPATMVLLGIGGLGLAIRKRRA